MVKRVKSPPVQAVMLVILSLGVGCAGPQASLTADGAESHEEVCTSSQQKEERDRHAATACRPHRTWLQEVGDAISGVASAFRAPNP
jgi:hypothetical protein